MANHKTGKERQNCSVYLSKEARTAYSSLRNNEGIKVAPILEAFILELKNKIENQK